MNYPKIQQFTAAFILFFLLFNITFRIPAFSPNVFAGSNEFYNLVSILVEEKMYSKIENKVVRYAEDISSVLPDTRVVILPVKKENTAFEIMTLNEGLFQEGYKTLNDVDFESKLIGSIFIGDLSIAEVYKGNQKAKTILPYVDFDDKAYIYNGDTERFEYNAENFESPQAEIWHGLIRPNTGDDNENEQALRDYFDKNHDFYSSTGNFKYENGVIDGSTNNSLPTSYEPYVFYFDGLGESRGLNYNTFKGYEAYQDNKEDIVYKRFTQSLANIIQAQVLNYSYEEIKELAEKVDSSLNLQQPGITSSNVPDIQTRHITEKTVKTFLETFSKGGISEMREYVHNAGRYNETGSKVNIDMIPYFLTLLDILNDEVLKNSSDEIEKHIDSIVRESLASDIYIPVQYGLNLSGGAGSIYTNYLHGQAAYKITSVSQCSIFRGSDFNNGQLTEANRGYNVYHSESDVNYLNNLNRLGGGKDYSCLTNIGNGSALKGVWGGNTPLNYSGEGSKEGNLTLRESNLEGSIVPLYDIEGSKKSSDTQNTPSPLNCLRQNFLLDSQRIWEAGPGKDGTPVLVTKYNLPTLGEYTGWSCNSFPQKGPAMGTYQQVTSKKTAGFCEDTKIYVDGKLDTSYKYNQTCTGGDDGTCECDGKWIIQNLYYNKIPSFLTHKSPVANTLQKQISNGVTPNLPVDKDRYVDFLDKTGAYKKINYPYLFRVGKIKGEILEDQAFSILEGEVLGNSIGVDLSEDQSLSILQNELAENTAIGEDIYKQITIKEAESKLIEKLNKVSKELNNIGGGNIDLVTYLKNKKDKTLSLDGESKTVTYFDTLVFAIYWNNMSSVSEKYAFLFENYLSDDLANDDKYLLPKNKKTYEIAYLGSQGDAQNMFIKLDPEAKKDHRYGDIVAKNNALNTSLLGLRSSYSSLRGSDEGVFKCAPPEGVDIFKWVPAIFCWIGNMLPPTISISDGSCGVSILSEEEREFINSCNGDVNKNGMNDCLENNLPDSQIILKSDSNKYYYNSLVQLTGTLFDKNNVQLRYANDTRIAFNIVKIESVENDGKDLKVVFDASDANKNNQDIVGKYVNFTPKTIKTIAGESSYGFSVKSEDINIYIQADLELLDNSNKRAISLQSETLEVQVRGERIFGTSYLSTNSNLDIGINSVIVSNEANIFLKDISQESIKNSEIINLSGAKQKYIVGLENINNAGDSKALAYPLDVKIYLDNSEILSTKVNSSQANDYLNLGAFDKTGQYKIFVQDNLGFSVTKNVTLLAEKASDIEVILGSNLIEKGGAVSTSILTINDKFGNPTQGDLYDIDLNISGDGLLFYGNNLKEAKFSTLEGYKPFRVISTDQADDNIINIQILQNEELLVEKDINLETIEKPSLFLKNLDNSMSVGGASYEWEVTLRKQNGTILTDMNSRVYVSGDRNIVVPEKPYFDLKNGKGTITLKTKQTAIEGLTLQFQVEGLSGILEKQIEVLPDAPMRLHTVVSQSKIKAEVGSSTELTVELKDRFNNTVFNQNSGSIYLEIPDEYKNVLTSVKNKSAIQRGKSSFTLSADTTPGTAYFKVSSDIGINNNSFSLQGSTGAIEVYGVGENTGKIETYYVWDGDKIASKKYNAIYTTLLGADYGNVDVQNYLAGELLFNRDNRALGVTSLLRNGKKENGVMSLQEEGNLVDTSTSSDITQDIQMSPKIVGNRFLVDIFNEGLNTSIGKVSYVHNQDVILKNCSYSECSSDITTSSIHLTTQNNNYSSFLDDDTLILKNNLGNQILSISKNGEYSMNQQLGFDIDQNNLGDHLAVNIFSGSEQIGYLEIVMKDSLVNTSRVKNVFEQKELTLTNTILLYINTYSYGTRIEKSGGKIIYNDPFGSSSTLDEFAQDFPYGYETYNGGEGLGWKGGNKSLLAFSAGESIGESTKEFQSFGSINLGDPVISLKKRERTIPSSNTVRKFDRTIGKQLGNDKNIHSYHVFDYDNDSLDDILLVKDDSNLKLLENKKGKDRVLDKGNIARIADLGNKDLVRVGDFSGDGYDDIFFVNNGGLPFILNNQIKDFRRVNLTSAFGLNGRIVRVEVFDMDSDGYDDIVTLDDSGEINILYGQNFVDIPSFEKKLISDDYGIIFDKQNSNHNGIIYFDELAQIRPTGADDKNIAVKNAINNFIYTPISYPVLQDSIPDIPDDQKIEGVPGVGESQKALEDFLRDNQDYISYTQGYKATEEKLFLKSQYSENIGLDFKREITDTNGGYLKSEDSVAVKITVQNNSNKAFNNIILGEKLLDVLQLDRDSIATSKISVITDGLAGYTFMVDSFGLNPGETFIVEYRAKTKALSYGYLQVGYFEKGELGDDNYGDILLKKNNQNCSNPVEIFRSEGKRAYKKGVTTPVCDSDENLPDILKKNNLDTDDNGIPDYIDTLLKGNTADIQKFAAEQKAELYKDSDNDGLPDDEDKITSSGDIFDIITSDDFSKNANSALDGLNETFEGLSCGFGGGACYASPLNWAPLAPGNDPTFMGKLIGDGLKVNEGIPVFSAVTGWQTTCGNVPCCLPSVFPAHSATYIPGAAFCGPPGAGGSKGVTSPTNIARIFVTPTITGAVGTAVCYGGPAIVAGNSVPKGFAPLVPGGNCIVAAKPILGCNNDGSEGNVASTGFSQVSGNFGIINGNCNNNTSDYVSLRPQLSDNFVKDYLVGGGSNSSLANDFKGAITEHSTSNLSGFQFGSEGGLFDGQFDVAAEGEGSDFEDIIKIQNKRPSAFPSFLMDWVTRQTEEFVNKLTDLPTLFIVLPDFSGVLDRDTWRNSSGQSDDIIPFDAAGALGRGYTGENETLNGISDSTKGSREWLSKNGQTVQTNVQEVYDFLANTPLITIREEPVHVNIPWIDLNDIDKKLTEYGQKLDEYNAEISRAKEAWSFGQACNYTDANAQQACEEKNEAANKAILKSEATIRSLEKNIEVIESYKKLPKQVADLIDTKEKYLEQILCNVEIISEITGGWIERNGERFKSWVDTYLLIKAILKSWQVMIDIFIDYDAECRECKNERQDSIGGQFDIIGSLNLNIPIIQLPKWPDIELDLHNIRVNMDIPLPSFNFETRPVIFPTLPDLSLPDVPSLGLGFPKLPILPTIELPELPDLPSLPSVELPNLPPPPKIPKIFANIEGVVDILKLVTKAMCIMKSSPFVPEWRAGDQIAFITERNGYLGSDFFDLMGPQFSVPWLDKIKVSSYVNLELEADFLVEMARQSVEPLNNFANNSVDLFDVEFTDIDIADIAPTNIDINLDESGEVDTQLGSHESDMQNLALEMLKNIGNFVGYLKQNSTSNLTAGEFKNEIMGQLSQESIASNVKLEGIQRAWDESIQYTYSREERKIKELKNKNFEKYETLKSIIGTEIGKTQNLSKKWSELGENPYLIQVADTQTTSDVDLYNKELQPYHDSFVKSAEQLLLGQTNTQEQELKNQGNDLLSRINSVSKDDVNLYTANIANTSGSTQSGPSCSPTKSNANKYNYKGLYVIEESKSYRLFDYMDELNGGEYTKLIDIDNDADEDLLYMVNKQLFVKENLNNDPQLTVASSPIILDREDNKYLNGERVIEAVNGLREIGLLSNGVNINFLSSTQEHVSNYRFEFYTIIDKFLNIGNGLYRPENISKNIYDLFSDIKENTLIEEHTKYKLSENIGSITKIGNFKDVSIKTQELLNIRDDISNGKSVNVGIGTTIYAGNTSFTVKYTQDNSDQVQIIHVGKNRNIELKEKVRILGITGNGYILSGNTISLEGSEILDIVGQPIFPNFEINTIGTITNTASYIELKYFDGTGSNLGLFDIASFKIFDLGQKLKNQYISFDIENDFYYGKIRSFSENTFGIWSSQIALSPQNSADLTAPSLSLDNIKIPVYQEKIIDIASYIYESGGIRNIKDVRIDMDLGEDSDNDGNPKNDSDVTSENISITGNKFLITFEKQDKLLNKQIGITLVDDNNNISHKEIIFEVYAPKPQITEYQDNVISGDIDEELEEEPVNLFRYRAGGLSAIRSASGSLNALTTTGKYRVELADNNKGLHISDGETIIGNVDENTGKITLIRPEYTIDVLSSNQIGNTTGYPKIVIEKGDEEIFFQYIQLVDNTQVELMRDNSEIDTQGMYVNFLNKKDYNYYTIPTTAEINPGAFVIYRTKNLDKQPLFILFPDGRIKTWNNDYDLSYNRNGDNINFELIDGVFKETIANLTFVLDGEYILK